MLIKWRQIVNVLTHGCKSAASRDSNLKGLRKWKGAMGNFSLIVIIVQVRLELWTSLIKSIGAFKA